MGPLDGTTWKIMFIPNNNDFDPERPTARDLENAIDISSAVTWEPITLTYEKEDAMKFEFKKGDKVEYLDSAGKWHPGVVTNICPTGSFSEDVGESPYQINHFWYMGMRGVRARQPQRKFKVGDKVRINMPTVNNDLHGKFGRVESYSASSYPYVVRVGLFQYSFKEDELESALSYGEAVNLEKPKADVVNHPSHYTSDPSGVECITITRHRNFNIGNAFKYLWRNGLKDSVGKDKRAKQIEDLKKAVFYINDEITRLGGTP